jgi:hypothetical protein
MTPSISCLYFKYDINSINIIFIKFTNFVKIIFEDRSIILTNEQLIGNNELFMVYIISLLLTEDTSRIYKVMIDHRNYYYGIYTMMYYKYIHLTNFYTLVSLEKSAKKRNPLKFIEPKRASSGKKYNKFMKLFYNVFRDINLQNIYNEFMLNETYLPIKYIEHRAQTTILTAILHNYGYDVYSAINRFVKI